MEQWLRDLLLILASALLGIFARNKLTPKEQAETIAVQGKTLSDAFDEIRELREEVKAVRDENKTLIKRNTALWKFVILMSEQMTKSELPLPPIPVELETDPEIAKLKITRK